MTDSVSLSRRGILASGCVLAGAGVLAACGSSDGPSASSPSASTGSTDGSASGGEVLATVAAIPVGGGSVFDGPKVVVTQPVEGEIKAFTAVCPHQGCLVNEVVDNQIICPCHGSLFSAEDGAVIQGPATSGLAPVAVTVKDGAIVAN